MVDTIDPFNLEFCVFLFYQMLSFLILLNCCAFFPAAVRIKYLTFPASHCLCA